MMILTAIISVIIIAMSAFWLPFFWIIILPIIFSLPHRDRTPVLIVAGLTLELFSGHLFGLAILAFLIAEWLLSVCEKIFNPESALRSVFALAGSVAALLVLAFSHTFVEVFKGADAGAESFGSWFLYASPGLIIALLFGAIASGLIHSKREKRFLLPGI